MVGHSLVLGARVLLLARLYQFSLWKDAYLSACRVPLHFFLANWRDEHTGALSVGLQHVMVCVGCCWALRTVVYLWSCLASSCEAKRCPHTAISLNARVGPDLYSGTLCYCLAPRENVMNEQWKICGDTILNCTRTVFCPCEVSLCDYPRTEGICRAWTGINMEDGFHAKTSLKGLKVGLLLDIPSQTSRGN